MSSSHFNAGGILRNSGRSRSSRNSYSMKGSQGANGGGSGGEKGVTKRKKGSGSGEMDIYYYRQLAITLGVGSHNLHVKYHVPVTTCVYTWYVLQQVKSYSSSSSEKWYHFTDFSVANRDMTLHLSISWYMGFD